MAAVTMFIYPTIGGAVVAEEHQACMVSANVSTTRAGGHCDLPLRCACQQIKCGIIVQEEILRITRLRADDVWALNGITAKEYRLSHWSVRVGLKEKVMFWHTQFSPTIS